MNIMIFLIISLVKKLRFLLHFRMEKVYTDRKLRDTGSGLMLNLYTLLSLTVTKTDRSIDPDPDVLVGY